MSSWHPKTNPEATKHELSICEKSRKNVQITSPFGIFFSILKGKYNLSRWKIPTYFCQTNVGFVDSQDCFLDVMSKLMAFINNFRMKFSILVYCVAFATVVSKRSTNGCQLARSLLFNWLFVKKICTN